MTLQGEKTKALYEKAKEYIPYGVNSNFRFWGDDTQIISRGEGAYIWDADGRRYIDYRLAFGPIILGHSFPEVINSVKDVLENGNLFAWTTPLEIEVAERIVNMCNVDKVRLTNTGTEATMHALRIARAYTGREKFIKFEGNYHGMCDYFMYSTASSQVASLGSPRSPIPSLVSSGVPRHIADYIYLIPFNDFERLEETVNANWGELAAIIVEPIMGNAAAILPKPGYLEKIRQLCDQFGIVMIMDEVKTGFRIARGGAQEFFSIQADIVTYAKAMGNGFPIAAIGGKEDVMMVIHPGQVAQGGTYTGNSVGAAAAAATLKILQEKPIIDRIYAYGGKLMEGIDKILTDADIPHHMTGLAPMFGYILGVEEEPKDFRQYSSGDDELYEKLAYELIHRGVMPDSDGREPWFMSFSHDEQVIDDTLNSFEDAVKVVVK